MQPPPRRGRTLSTSTPQEPAQDDLYDQYRAMNPPNIDPIPFAKRPPSDHRAYLPIILAQIAAYNQIDDPAITYKGCIAPGDKAFELLVKKLNDTHVALNMSVVGIDDVPHEPWCVPGTVGGAGPRR